MPRLLEQSDEALMQALATGEAAALDVLVARHQDRLLSFCFRFLRDRQAAEDAVQEAFVALWRDRARWEPKARVTTWLYQIARNQCVSAGRKRAVRSARTIDPEVPPAASGPGPDTDVRRAEDRDRVARCVQDLPEMYREVVVFRMYEDLPFKEIAAITGVNESTLRTRFEYALDKLRLALK